MKWTDELIKEELLKSIKVLGLDRMPTGGELKSIGRNDLHCKISRTKKYSGYAKELGLELKRSTTTIGWTFEYNVLELLEEKGFKSEKMTTKHPYDLLVEGVVKVDVKIANPYLMRGEHRIHTFNLQKDKPTCDIYICVAMDEQENVERLFIIPSHHIQMKMLNVGTKSKYNDYVNKFEYIEKYVNFFKGI